jgi:hypothetical protein
MGPLPSSRPPGPLLGVHAVHAGQKADGGSW